MLPAALAQRRQEWAQREALARLAPPSDAAARTSGGETALQLAKEKGHAECERAFEAAAREAKRAEIEAKVERAVAERAAAERVEAERAAEEAAAALLAEHREEVPPGVVVAALDADAAEAGLSTGADEARSRLHAYLHALFERDPTAGAELHGRQVRNGVELPISGLTVQPRRMRLNFDLICPGSPN